ncbi:MAG: Asp-tRNA(Asn)/Glu-tRNA(Gln) amidotransferase subunit GatC [Phycisphaerae bacterium]|nr:Asp-tRNA(Asn)/Glu-tRNA(Gln) amidotransferase subunit GatC [Phycisphaerae bacterium]
MTAKIDEAQVRRVALLSRLELSNEEVAQFSTQLSDIVEYIEKLSGLDTDNVQPLAHCLPVYNVLREDVPHPSLTNDQALANAPDREDEYFKVPKILDDNSGA